MYGLETADRGALVLYGFGVDHLNRPTIEGPRCATQPQTKKLPAVTDVYLDGRSTTSSPTARTP